METIPRLAFVRIMVFATENGKLLKMALIWDRVSKLFAERMRKDFWPDVHNITVIFFSHFFKPSEMRIGSETYESIDTRPLSSLRQKGIQKLVLSFNEATDKDFVLPHDFAISGYLTGTLHDTLCNRALCMSIEFSSKRSELDRAATTCTSPLVYEQFERADANGDGKLDKCEFPNKDKWVAQNNEQQFTEFDTNADGFVSKEEQDAYIKKQEDEAKRWQQEFYNSTIQQFDTNGDQLLQQDELTALLKTWYSYKPGATFNFASFDTNGDNGLDAEELGDFEQNIPWDDLEPVEQEFQATII